LGLRRGMMMAVGFWTFASVSHAFAGGFWTFATARATLGFGEGATFPGGLRTVMQTLRADLRSRGIAIAYSGGSLGAVITPIIITPVALRWGWRGAFWFTGMIGALWLLLWYFVSRRDDIKEASPRDNSTTSVPSLWDPRLWSFMVSYAFGGLPIAFVLYNTSLYLARVKGLDQATIGELLWIPPLGWEVGYFFWGWRADRAGLRHHGAYPAFLRYYLLLLLLSLPLAVLGEIQSVAIVMAALFFAMFVAAGFIIIPVAYATSTFSSAHAGYLAGLAAGAWSALVALVMPFFGHLFDRGEYSQAFLAAAAFPVAGTLLWWILSRIPQSAKA
jgi:MFS transporter, ACS family, aldohexuronate transporter